MTTERVIGDAICFKRLEGGGERAWGGGGGGGVERSYLVSAALNTAFSDIYQCPFLQV